MYEYAIETQALSKQYGTQIVIKEMNMRLPKGKIYALLGRNGAGKTTTIRMLMGLIKPSLGAIRFFGKEIMNNENNIYSRVGSLIENPCFYSNLTAHENLSLLLRLRGINCKNAIENALKIVNLHGETKKTFGKFSLGMKQRLGIAAAIMHDPELLVLDEPINGLDPIGVAEVRKLLLSLCVDKKITILLSSHILSEIEQIADVIGLLNDSELKEYNVAELKKKTEQYHVFGVSDSEKVVDILSNHFPKLLCKIVSQDVLHVFYAEDNIAILNKLLVENGVGVSLSYPQKTSLEDLFIEMTGGVGIA